MEYAIGVVSKEKAPERCSKCRDRIPCGVTGTIRQETGDSQWLCRSCFADLAPILSLHNDALHLLRLLGKLPKNLLPVAEIWLLCKAVAVAAERHWGPLEVTKHERQLMAIGKRAKLVARIGEES